MYDSWRLQCPPLSNLQIHNLRGTLLPIATIAHILSRGCKFDYCCSSALNEHMIGHTSTPAILTPFEYMALFTPLSTHFMRTIACCEIVPQTTWQRFPTKSLEKVLQKMISSSISAGSKVADTTDRTQRQSNACFSSESFEVHVARRPSGSGGHISSDNHSTRKRTYSENALSQNLLQTAQVVNKWTYFDATATVFMAGFPRVGSPLS